MSEPWYTTECSCGGRFLKRPGSVQDSLQVVPEEDAYLFAAAPELLEACKQAEASLEARGFSPDRLGTLWALRQAIAKAEGRKA